MHASWAPSTRDFGVSPCMHLKRFFFGIGPRVFTATEQFVYGARKVLKCTTTERETATDYSETGHAYTLLRRRIANRLHLDRSRPLYLGHVI